MGPQRSMKCVRVYVLYIERPHACEELRFRRRDTAGRAIRKITYDLIRVHSLLDRQPGVDCMARSEWAIDAAMPGVRTSWKLLGGVEMTLNVYYLPADQWRSI